MDQPSKETQLRDIFLPPGMVLILLLLTIFFFLLVGQGLTYLLVTAQGLELTGLLTDTSTPTLERRNLMRMVALINHLFSFLLPGLIFAMFLYREDWGRFLRIRRVPGWWWLGLGIFWILLAFPMAQGLFFLNKMLPLPEWAISMEDSTMGLIQSFLIMESPMELVLTLLVMALLPAIGEELIFRGIIQQTLEQRFHNPHLTVWVAAAIFSAFHLQFEGFIPRMLLGGILGYLFVWSRNIWVPIAAHFANNGIQVVAAYVMGKEKVLAQEEELDASFWWLVGFSTLLTLGLGYFLQGRAVPEVAPGASEERAEIGAANDQE